MNKRLPFTVIGGYLGAGKTTLLNHLLSNANGLRIVALVNDFGNINIDASLISSQEGETINLANGCMCCSLVDNFAVTIQQICQRANDFDHIVIEASGISDPGKIAQYGQMYHLPLDGILVLADAEQVRKQANNKYVGDTVIRQFSQADLIILNKTDLISVEELSSLYTWFGEIASGIPLINTVESRIPINILLGQHGDHNLLNRKFSLDSNYLDNIDHTNIFESWTVEYSQPLDRESIANFSNKLGEDIYRAKGFVWLKEDTEHRYIYQKVGNRWSLKPDQVWENSQQQTQLIVIGKPLATTNEAITNLLIAKFE